MRLELSSPAVHTASNSLQRSWHDQRSRIIKKSSALTPSQFISESVYIPIQEQNTSTGTVRTVLRKFSYEGRRYLLKPYNTNAQRVLLMCGRQVEKTTLLGNIIFAYVCLRRYFRALFVSPTQQQTETFSRDRLQSPIEMSADLKAFMQGGVSKNNVLYKKFATGSDVTLRYAFLSADRIRGVSADMLMIDELQDILTDVIPVIEEALSHSKHFRIFRYSGTPKSIDNTIAYYWENYSTQNEWVIPCDGCGSKTTGRYWNIPGIRNIGKHHLVCSKCHKRIYAVHPDARWASMNPKPAIADFFEGYRIPQIITPWVNWDSIVTKYKAYGRKEFYNEVLGYGYEMGERPLTSLDVRKCCLPNLSIYKPRSRQGAPAHFAGIDWGTGENSYTVLLVGGYYGDRFRIVYAHRFEGEETDPEVTIRLATEIIRRFRCLIIGVDYGGGFDRNSKLIRTFGIRRVVQYQYANPSDKMVFQKKLGRYMLRRTEVLYDLIEAIKRGNEFEFPCWEEWEEPYARDMTNTVSEYNEARKQQVLNKVPGATDDTLHALLYAFFASMVYRPRPDILRPGSS